MTLQDLIHRLQQSPQDRVIHRGFDGAHSYRGSYYELAFEPARDVTVGSMLEEARSALGKTFQGYKGGDFTMYEFTDVYLANYGECGDMISDMGLEHMLECNPQ